MFSLRKSHLGRVFRPLAVAVLAVVVSLCASTVSLPASAANDELPWLDLLNAYRAQSGLAPVTENATWSAGAREHSCWMLLNGISHDEAVGTPGYTVAGDEAGNNGNVAVSSSSDATVADHFAQWMSGPFHAIGVLRPGLRESGFGKCTSPPSPSATPWNSAATLDVLRGVSGPSQLSSPVVYPGNGATSSLDRFTMEAPDPRTFCGWDGRSVGLPLIAMFPEPPTSPIATLVGPDGPVEVCVLSALNTSGVAQSILGGDNAVVVVPAVPLSPGQYQAAVQAGGQSAAWGFGVDPTYTITAERAPDTEPVDVQEFGPASSFEPVGPFRLVDTRRDATVSRLPGGQIVRIPVGSADGRLPVGVHAISANFTAVNTAGPGYLTVFDCGDKPETSTLNYRPGDVVANQAIVALDGGDICAFSLADTDLIVDVNGAVTSGADGRYHAVRPARVLDTRTSTPLAAGEIREAQIVGGGFDVPPAATAAVVNLAGVLPASNGFVRLFPCGVAEPTVSTVNPFADTVRANSAIVPLGADGSLCLSASTSMDVVVDITGWIGPDGELEFSSVNPIRLTDTRSLNEILNPATSGSPLTAGATIEVAVAGHRGMPVDVSAVSANVTAVGGAGPGFVSVVPCGDEGRTSTVNFVDSNAVANSAIVAVDAVGSICITSSTTVDVVIDIVGIWK